MTSYKEYLTKYNEATSARSVLFKKAELALNRNCINNIETDGQEYVKIWSVNKEKDEFHDGDFYLFVNRELASWVIFGTKPPKKSSKDVAFTYLDLSKVKFIAIIQTNYFNNLF